MRLGFLLLLVLVFPWRGAAAMQFAYGPVSGVAGGGMIFASGRVTVGDDAKLRSALGAVPAGARLVGLSLDSPGGNAEEGVLLADTVREKGLGTFVGQGAMCASACFNVFAAGSRRFASTTALIGVHGASYGGRDDVYAQAETVRLARQLAGFGVPDVILGKMITAQPNQMWWLNRDDLETMRVEFVALQATDKRATAEPAPTGSTDAAAAGSEGKLGARVESPATGFRVVAPPKGGFHVWNPRTDH